MCESIGRSIVTKITLSWVAASLGMIKILFDYYYLFNLIKTLYLKAVLERGVLNYYPSRADSTGNNKCKRRDYKYLDSARISILPTLTSFIVHFSDGSLHRLSVVSNDEKAQVERQVIQFPFNSLKIE